MARIGTKVRTGVTEDEYDRIEDRKRPPVAGVDLEHALNYVRAAPIGLEFFYCSFTQPITFYKRSSRPKLEDFVDANVDAQAVTVKRLHQCVDALAQHVPHHVHFGDELPADRAPSEEQILEQGRGWCNEQARLLAAMTQISGMPSRLLFAQFHTICEVYVDRKWVTVDQTFGHVFESSVGDMLNVLDIRSDEKLSEDANLVYQDRISAVRRSIEKRRGAGADNRGMFAKWAATSRPILIFDNVGYCNYFVH